MPPLLELRGITKRFPGVLANDNIDLSLNEGEILDIKFDSPHIQIWKPKQDNFICIEPWYGWNDMFYNAPEDITKKEQIIKLEVGRTWSATFELKVITNKK